MHLAHLFLSVQVLAFTGAAPELNRVQKNNARREFIHKQTLGTRPLRAPCIDRGPPTLLINLGTNVMVGTLSGARFVETMRSFFSRGKSRAVPLQLTRCTHGLFQCSVGAPPAHCLRHDPLQLMVCDVAAAHRLRHDPLHRCRILKAALCHG